MSDAATEKKGAAMRYDYRGLIANACRSIAKKDGGTAYALYELADNLSVLLNGKCSVEEFRDYYVGHEDEPFIRDGLMPGEKGYEDRAPVKELGL